MWYLCEYQTTAATGESLSGLTTDNNRASSSRLQFPAHVKKIRWLMSTHPKHSYVKGGKQHRKKKRSVVYHRLSGIFYGFVYE